MSSHDAPRSTGSRKNKKSVSNGSRNSAKGGRSGGKSKSSSGANDDATRIAPVSPILDFILTVAYLFSCLWVCNVYVGRAFGWRRPHVADPRVANEDFIKPEVAKEDLVLFLLSLVMVSVIIRFSNLASRKFGAFISATFLSKRPFYDPLKNRKTMHKWCDTTWQLVIHVSMAALEIYVVMDETWYSDPQSVWIAVPCRMSHKLSLRCLYTIQLSIWMVTAFSHRFLEERRKDYVVMYVHHIATILLMAASLDACLLPIGLLVLLVHDLSDVPVDLLKLANYLKLESSQGLFCSEIMYVMNLCSWIYFRIYLFPIHIIYSATVVQYRVTAYPPEIRERFVLENLLNPTPHWIMISFLLALLACLHVWWTFLFIRIGFKIVMKGGHQAGREEYEGDSSESDKGE